MPNKENNNSIEEKINSIQLAFGVVAESLKMYYTSLKMTGMPDDLIEKLIIGMQTILMAPALGIGGPPNNE